MNVSLCRVTSTFLISLVVSLFILSCNDTREKTLLTDVPNNRTNIDFANEVEDNSDFNILDYLYFYNGGGVSMGDINNDGLPDLYFSGNQVENKLYINKGDFRFEDATNKAGVGGRSEEWSSGVTMVDINGDGLLDIYVCQVNYLDKEGHNLLYINNGDTTFTEKSEKYNLDFEGMSTQAAFFDYDRDGDLDVYLMNHSVHAKESFQKSSYRNVDAPRVGDKLYENKNGYFDDVTSETGIYSSALGYGLGLAISDVNKDGWPDIYVGNDFHEDDYLYFNNGDGTFTEKLQQVAGHTSRSSMGNDIADFNNDGNSDIFSLDMLPPDVPTYRKSAGPDNEKVYRIKRRYGFSHQYSRNTLQLNRGGLDGSPPLYSEIGLYSDVHATDWSWAGLFVDLNNNSWKDLFVTNGILRRPNNLDYVNYISRPKVRKMLNNAPIEKQLRVLQRMPRSKSSNYIFRNNGDLTFSDRSKEWGVDNPGVSHGAAYGDLDDDGDIDLAINNTNEPATIYENTTDTTRSSNYISINLVGQEKNTSGLGSKVFVYSDEKTLYREQTPTRGFQSSVSHVLHFGLGDHQRVDSLLVIWPDGRYQRLRQVDANQELTLRQRAADGSYSYEDDSTEAPLFERAGSSLGIDFSHRENDFDDFQQQPLIPHKLSTQGPALAVADVNGDELDDFYFGGAHQQAGRLFLQQPNGGVISTSGETFRQDQAREDVDATFFDADGDGDRDLYVVSGGGEFADEDKRLQDRLYLNDGESGFTRSTELLPEMRSDGASVISSDYDEDGDIDLFVGTRSVPGSYGKSPTSHLLLNNGNGKFRTAARNKAPGLRELGMVTDAIWADVYGDDMLDLITVGEWMPVTVFGNENGTLENVTSEMGLGQTNGFWRSISAGDFDGDGDVDVIGGNQGKNSIFRATSEHPLELFVNDFNGDGESDPIIAEHRNGGLYTWARRDELLTQLPNLKRDIPTYEAYSEMTIDDIFSQKALRKSSHKKIFTLESTYFENTKGVEFKTHSLPAKSQFSPIQSIIPRDFTGDGVKDLLIGENFFGSDTKQGRYDAGYGLLLTGNEKGTFTSVPIEESGFMAKGEVRDMEIVRGHGSELHVLIARNDDPPLVYRWE